MSEKYDYILKWTKNSTKEDHHIPEIEEFARNSYVQGKHYTDQEIIINYLWIIMSYQNQLLNTMKILMSIWKQERECLIYLIRMRKTLNHFLIL